MITNQFLFFKFRKDFNLELGYGNVSEASIAFIEDTKEIWTHGTFFSSPEIKNLDIVTSKVLSEYVKLEQLQTKQDTLVSGENIKTINGNSILDSGDISVVTPGNIGDYLPEPPEETIIDSELSSLSTNPVQNRTITDALDTKANRSDVDAALQTKANVSTVAEYAVSLNDKVDRSELLEYPKTDVVESIIDSKVQELLKIAEKSKGYYDSLEELILAVPNPEVGDWAVVNSENLWVMCRCQEDGTWTLTELEFKQEEIDLSNYVKYQDLTPYVTTLSLQTRLDDIRTEINKKQDTLISNHNVKTINGQSILGSDNIQIDTDYEYVDNRFDALRTSISSHDLIIEQKLRSIEDYLNYIRKKYIKWAEDDPSEDYTESGFYASNLVTLTTDEYQSLVLQGLVKENTYYFTYTAPTVTSWHFGEQFPILFTADNLGVFPITLT